MWRAAIKQKANRTHRLVLTVLLAAGLTAALTQSMHRKHEAGMKRYTKVSAGYLMVLRQGDNLFDALEKFARDENLPSANFSGMGFVDITFGFFDFEKKEYKPKDFNKVELASMQGSIAWKEGKPSIHAHGVAGDQSFQTFGGHILKATVNTGSLEILIIPHDKPFERKHDDSIGADVLEIQAP
jgi:predicted DNA-binding protein with PD1-like motif